MVCTSSDLRRLAQDVDRVGTVFAVVVGELDLDQLVMASAPSNSLSSAGVTPLLADHDHGIERMREAAQVTLLVGSDSGA